MDGLVEIKQWLHVWTEAERARRLNKKPCTEAQGEDLPKQAGGEQTKADCQRIMWPHKCGGDNPN